MNRTDITKEIRRLKIISKGATERVAGLTSKVSGSQTTAMCLGAMYAFCWILGLGEAPSIEIQKKVREVHGK